VHFHVDPLSPAPPSEQLADQVRFAVAAGRLESGARLPSLRALAESVRVNPNTVSRAWRMLEQEGVLESRRGDGMYVTAEARAACRAARDRIVAERIGRSVADARAAGLKEAEVLAWTREALAHWREHGADIEADTEADSHASR
jgi:GntR family transcriptional regulator